MRLQTLSAFAIRKYWQCTRCLSKSRPAQRLGMLTFLSHLAHACMMRDNLIHNTHQQKYKFDASQQISGARRRRGAWSTYCIGAQTVDVEITLCAVVPPTTRGVHDSSPPELPQGL